MPDEGVVLREDIARALLGEGLRIPMKPPPIHGHNLAAHRHIW
jgi:hypothetical protein